MSRTEPRNPASPSLFIVLVLETIYLVKMKTVVGVYTDSFSWYIISNNNLDMMMAGDERYTTPLASFARLSIN